MLLSRTLLPCLAILAVFAVDKALQDAAATPDAPAEGGDTAVAATTEEGEIDPELAALLKKINDYLSSIQANNGMLVTEVTNANYAEYSVNTAYEHYVTNMAEGFSDAFRAEVAASKTEVNAKYVEVVALAAGAYDAAVAAFAKAEEVMGELGYELVDPNAEPEDEAPDEEDDGGYKYTKYTEDDDFIVRVEYENGVSFILNFNYFDVTVVYNGTQYTVSSYGGVRLNADGTFKNFRVIEQGGAEQ